MLLWDYEMKPERHRIEAMPEDVRFSLAVQAIEWTLASMDSPFEDAAVRSVLERALSASRTAPQGAVTAVAPVGLVEDLEEMDDEVEEPGATHFISAVSDLFDIPADGMTSDGLYGVLSYLYEGSLDREEIPEITSSTERQNVRCLEIIEFQKELISSVTPH
ncbi:hypothetical protein [Streptomyces triculaminicus]|uniref:hypothetical protein n=1 Tax=Streptomyces triculaminicus TaxID=2816232 RepID=UPI0037CF0942